MNLLGINKKDLGEFDEAEMLFLQALTYVEAFRHSSRKPTLYHNLGSLYGERKMYGKALFFLRQALEYADQKHPEKMIKTLYLLAKLLYESGETREAEKYVRCGSDICQKYEEKAYYYRFRLLKLEFCSRDTDYMVLCQEAIAFFERHDYWELARAYSEKLASLYKKEKRYKEASEFFDRALQAKQLLQKEEGK